MTLRRNMLLRLGLVAGLALVLSGCYRHYPGYSYAPRTDYAAPHAYGHAYKPDYIRRGDRRYGRGHYRRGHYGHGY